MYPGYFDSLGVPVLQGRDFGGFDIVPGAPYVAVINETFAKVAFPNENPIGKKVLCNGEQVCDVIGVVKDSRYSSLREQTPSAIYQSFLQAPTGRGQMVLHVRFKGNVDRILPQVRRYITGLDSNTAAFEIRTLAAEVDATLVRDRLLALLSGLFGALAVLLAMVGLYGVISYAASRRAKEIGVRMALGASAHDVRYLVLRETIGLAGLGILIGISIAAAASRLIETFLYGLTPTYDSDHHRRKRDVFVIDGHDCGISSLATRLTARSGSAPQKRITRPTVMSRKPLDVGFRSITDFSYVQSFDVSVMNSSRRTH